MYTAKTPTVVLFNALRGTKLKPLFKPLKGMTTTPSLLQYVYESSTTGLDSPQQYMRSKAA